MTMEMMRRKDMKWKNNINTHTNMKMKMKTKINTEMTM